MRVSAMFPFIEVLGLSVILGCARQDPIDRVVTRMNSESVPSYLYTPISLAGSASPERCIAELANRGRLTNFKILEARDVVTTFGHYTAVLVDADNRQKVVLLKPVKTNAWYWKIYDIK
jgi:hypothetical protein